MRVHTIHQAAIAKGHPRSSLMQRTERPCAHIQHSNVVKNAWPCMVPKIRTAQPAGVLWKHMPCTTVHTYCLKANVQLDITLCTYTGSRQPPQVAPKCTKPCQPCTCTTLIILPALDIPYRRWDHATKTHSNVHHVHQHINKCRHRCLVLGHKTKKLTDKTTHWCHVKTSPPQW